MNAFKMGKALLALLVALLCAELLPALPVDVSGADASTAAATGNHDTAHVVRSRRKVGNVTNTPRQYMEDLLSRFTTNDNRPIHREQDPTDVWCFLDKGEAGFRMCIHSNARSAGIYTWRVSHAAEVSLQDCSCYYLLLLQELAWL